MREFLGRPTCPRWSALDHIVTLPMSRVASVVGAAPLCCVQRWVEVTGRIDEPDEGVL